MHRKIQSSSQHCPRYPPRCLKHPFQPPQNSQKPIKTNGFSMFFAIQPMCPNHKKSSQNLPSRAETDHLGAILAQLGAIMAHLGRNLLPTWPILRPSWAHLRPNFAKNLHQIAPEISRSAPRDPKTTQGVARGLQDSPWSLNFNGFGVAFGLHLQIYFKGFDAICDPMLNPTSKPQVWHGGGFARAAHWISAAPRRGVGRV